MKVLDYHRSFFFFETDFVAKPPKTVSDLRQNTHNRARIRIDCRCVITAPGGKTAHFYLGESCKTERVGCSKEQRLFVQPNADFRMAYSPDECSLAFKSWDRNDKGVMLSPPSLGPQPERQPIILDDAFYRHGLMLKEVRAEELKTPKKIIAATDAGRPLIARNVFKRAGFRILLEYPIFTFNVSERLGFYQTDTGPVLYPEVRPGTKQIGPTLRLAYAAFYCRDWVEFIVQRPTPLTKDISVNHYSGSVQTDSVNTLYATD